LLYIKRLQVVEVAGFRFLRLQGFRGCKVCGGVVPYRPPLFFVCCWLLLVAGCKAPAPLFFFFSGVWRLLYGWRLSNIALLLNNILACSGWLLDWLQGVEAGWRTARLGSPPLIANPSPSEPKN